MTDWITSIMESLGYFGIGLLMLLENVFPPIPSEMIMPLAGFTAAQGNLGIVLVVLAGTVGSLLGAIGWYWAAQKLGAERLRAWSASHGRWLGITPDEFDRAQEWFGRHGRAAVFVGRLVPGIRTLISVPAGLCGMPFATFVTYTLAGTAVWTALLALAGYILRSNWQVVEQYVSPIGKIVLVALVLWFIVRIVRRRRTAGSRAE
jgi:membrane protein DedA with SNARE-associated domain